MKRRREREERAKRERKFSEAWLLFFEKFFSSFFQVTLETKLAYTSTSGVRLKLLCYEYDYLFIKIAKLDTLLRKNTEETLRFLNKNVEQTHIKPRGRRVGKKRLPSRVRRLSRPEPVRENAERKLRRGVRHLGKTVHGVPMATRTRREV